MYASAADSDAVRQWQAGAAGTISWAKRRGFAVVVQDESIFLRTGTNGRKLWSRVGEPVAVIRHGRRDKGHRVRRACRGRDPADAAVRKVRRPDVREMPQGGPPEMGQGPPHNGQRGQHKTKAVRKYLEEHDEVEILYLPTATPKLSAVESVWKDAKYRLVTSEHYETLEDLTHAVSEYFRTCSIRLDIYKFLYRCV